MGWREPHAFYVVERMRPSGTWEPLPVGEVLRCGVYAEDWTKDMRILAPGERVIAKALYVLIVCVVAVTWELRYFLNTRAARLALDEEY